MFAGVIVVSNLPLLFFVVLEHDYLTYFPLEPITAHTIPSITALTPDSGIPLGLLGPWKIESIVYPKILGNN